jgi:Sigma 54 modulation protein / S30EA ribosomal protein
MQVLVDSDHHIASGGDLTQRVQGVVEGRLDRYGGRITRVSVHLHDLNGDTNGGRAGQLGARDARRTLRCLMEVRLGGMMPLAVSHEAPTLAEAIHVAADKLERALDHALGKLEDTTGQAAQQARPPEAAPAARGGHLAAQVASIEALPEIERTEADHG